MRSLRLISVVAFAIGAIHLALTAVLGNDPRLFELVERVLMQNAAPLAAAIIVIGRSATVIALNSICVQQVAALRHLRISAHDYLVEPRVSAITNDIGCCFYSQLVAVIDGSRRRLHTGCSLGDQLHRFARTSRTCVRVLKSALFGWFIAIVACHVNLINPRRI